MWICVILFRHIHFFNMVSVEYDEMRIKNGQTTQQPGWQKYIYTENT